jgi:hypothetical protein
MGREPLPRLHDQLWAGETAYVLAEITVDEEQVGAAAGLQRPGLTVDAAERSQSATP